MWPSHLMYSHLIPADRRGLKISHPHEYFTAAHSLLWWLALYFSSLHPVFASFQGVMIRKDGKLNRPNLYDMACFLKWLEPCFWPPPLSASAFAWKDIDTVYLLRADSSILSQHNPSSLIWLIKRCVLRFSRLSFSMSSRMDVRAEVGDVVLSDH